MILEILCYWKQVSFCFNKKKGTENIFLNFFIISELGWLGQISELDWPALQPTSGGVVSFKPTSTVKWWFTIICSLFLVIRSCVPCSLWSVPVFRSVRSLFLPWGMFHCVLVYLYFRSPRNISRYSSVHFSFVHCWLLSPSQYRPWFYNLRLA